MESDLWGLPLRTQHLRVVALRRFKLDPKSLRRISGNTSFRIFPQENTLRCRTTFDVVKI